MRYKLVIFDLDGTILSTAEDLCLAVNRAMQAFDLPEHTVEEVISYVGNGSRKLIARAVGSGVDVDLDAVHDAYRRFYIEGCCTNTRPYDGIPELLEALRAGGCIVACNTNKPEIPANMVLDKYLPGLIDYRQPQIDGVPRKPDPTGALTVLAHYGLAPEKCCYVGDSDVDIRTGAAAGIDVISVSWGFKSREVLERSGAACVVDSVEELRQKLLG